MNYSNPRTYALINDWPSGSYRTQACFYIETHPKRGERGVRTTLHPKTLKPSKPKTLTYTRQARIVDGDDGKTYIIELSLHSQGISVMQGNMQFQQEVLWPGDERYNATAALFG